MAVFEVTSPRGIKYRLEHPSEPSQEEIDDAMAEIANAEADTGEGVIESTLAAVPRGFVQGIGSLVEGVGDIAGESSSNNLLQEAGQGIKNRASREFSVNPALEDEFAVQAGGVIGGVAEQALELAGPAILGAGSRAIKAIGLTSAGIKGADAGEDIAERYQVEGGSRAALMAGFGAAEAGSEMLGGFGAEAALGKLLTGNLAETGLKGYAKAVVPEYFEEAGNTVLQNTVTNLAVSAEEAAAAGLPLPAYTEGANEAGLLGLVGGGVMATPVLFAKPSVEVNNAATAEAIATGDAAAAEVHAEVAATAALIPVPLPKIEAAEQADPTLEEMMPSLEPDTDPITAEDLPPPIEGLVPEPVIEAPVVEEEVVPVATDDIPATFTTEPVLTPQQDTEQKAWESSLIDTQGRISEPEAVRVFSALKELGATGADLVINNTGRTDDTGPTNEVRGSRRMANGRDTIYLNRNTITADTPLHEVGHGFIPEMRNTAPQLYEQGKALVNAAGKPLADAIKARYARRGLELSEEDLLHETLTTLNGNENAEFWRKYVKDPRLIQQIQQWIAQFQEWVGQHLSSKGIDPNMTVAQFAKKVNRHVLAGRARSNTGTGTNNSLAAPSRFDEMLKRLDNQRANEAGGAPWVRGRTQKGLDGKPAFQQIEITDLTHPAVGSSINIPFNGRDSIPDAEIQTAVETKRTQNNETGNPSAPGGVQTSQESVPVERGVSGSSSRVESPGASATQGTPLTSLPGAVNVPGRGKVTFTAYAPAQKAAADYVASTGRTYTPPTEYVRVNKQRAAKIAQAYEEMDHNPSDPAVAASYRAMIDETLAQWEAIKATGLKVEPIREDMDDPYAVSPRLAVLDVIENNHLWFFPTDFGFGGTETSDVDISGNPLMEMTGETLNGMPLRANDVFRIVHDYFGHVKEGVGFRADGEDNAWRSHSAMYSPLARKAMTTETRGQNSWVNFGRFGEFNQTAPGAETQYAPQKTGLLPDWTMDESPEFEQFSLNAPTRSGVSGNQPGTPVREIVKNYTYNGEAMAPAYDQAVNLYNPGEPFESHMQMFQRLIDNPDRNFYKMTAGAYFGLVARDLSNIQSDPAANATDVEEASRNIRTLMAKVAEVASSGGQLIKGFDIGLKIANNPTIIVQKYDDLTPFDGNEKRRKKFEEERDAAMVPLSELENEAVAEAPEDALGRVVEEGINDTIRGEEAADSGAYALDEEQMPDIAEAEADAVVMESVEASPQGWFGRAVSYLNRTLLPNVNEWMMKAKALGILTSNTSEGELSLSDGDIDAGAEDVLKAMDAEGLTKKQQIERLKAEVKALEASVADNPEADLQTMVVERLNKNLNKLLNGKAKKKNKKLTQNQIATAISSALLSKAGYTGVPVRGDMTTALGLLLANQDVAAASVQDIHNLLQANETTEGMITLDKLKAFMQLAIGREFDTAEGASATAAPYGEKQIAAVLRSELKKLDINLTKIVKDAAMVRSSAEALEKQLRDPSRALSTILTPEAMDKTVAAVLREYNKTAKQRAVELQKRNDQIESDKAVREAAKESKAKRAETIKRQNNKRKEDIAKLTAQIKQMTPGKLRDEKSAEREAIMTAQERADEQEKALERREKEDTETAIREGARDAKDKRRRFIDARRRERREARRQTRKDKKLPEALDYDETKALEKVPGEKIVQYLSRQFGFDLGAIQDLMREDARKEGVRKMTLTLADALGLSKSQAEAFTQKVVAQAMKTMDAGRKKAAENKVRQSIEAKNRRKEKVKKGQPTEAERLVKLVEQGRSCSIPLVPKSSVRNSRTN